MRTLSLYGNTLAADKAPVINMLNTKYAFVPLRDGTTLPVRNPYAMGNAWFVDSLVCVNNANDECAALSTLDLHHVAVTDTTYQAWGLNSQSEGNVKQESATIELTAYSPKTLEYKSNTETEKLAVFSEIYYPYGWKATIDGKPTDIYRVNYMLRAMLVPAGEHILVMTFEPDSVRKGNTLSLCCLIIFLLTLLGTIGWKGYLLFNSQPSQQEQ